MDTKNINNRLKNFASSGASTAAVMLIITSLLTVSSYITSIIEVNLNSNTNNNISAFIYGCAKITSGLVYALVSAGVAKKIGGANAFSAGLIGGMISSVGTSFYYPSGNTTSISGLWGAILSGFVAGYSVLIIDKIYKKRSFSPRIYELLRPIIPIITTMFFALTLNHIAEIISLFASTALAILSKNNVVLCALVAGILINIDGYGPCHLATYVFSSASCATGDFSLTASITAAYITMPLGIVLCAIVFKEKFSECDRKISYAGVITGLCGAVDISYYHYIKNPAATILACTSGGTVASILSLMMGCGAEYPNGGLLTISRIEKPIYFILSVLCGAFVTATILALTIRNTESTESTDSYDSATIVA